MIIYPIRTIEKFLWGILSLTEGDACNLNTKKSEKNRLNGTNRFMGLLAVLVIGIVMLATNQVKAADSSTGSSAQAARAISTQISSNEAFDQDVCHTTELSMVQLMSIKASDVTVYVTKTGAKYHKSSCRYLSKSKIAIKLSKAVKKYTPCKICKPPVRKLFVQAGKADRAA